MQIARIDLLSSCDRLIVLRPVKLMKTQKSIISVNDMPDYAIAVGVPAKVIKSRKST